MYSDYDMSWCYCFGCKEEHGNCVCNGTWHTYKDKDGNEQRFFENSMGVQFSEENYNKLKK